MSLPVDIESFTNVFGDPNDQPELHPELRAYVRDEGGNWGRSIKHPIYYHIIYDERMNKFVNTQYEAKKQAMRELYAKGKFRTWVWFHERPWRLWAFQQIEGLLSDHHYWELLGELWIDSENIWENLGDWYAALHSDRPRRWAFMGSKAERDKLKSMRKTPILVWRGYSWPDGDQGLSWTLNKRIASWFANRLIGLDPIQVPMVATGVVDHKDVIAYRSARNEDEIIVLPEHVHIIRQTEVVVGASRSPAYE